MTKRPTIVVAGLKQQDFLFDPIESGLRERGFRTLRHKGPLDGLMDNPAWSDADVIVTHGVSAFSRAVMEKAPHLRAILSVTIGTEGIDDKAASALGILIANCSVPENYEGVAEGTILLMLAGLLNLPAKERALRENTRMEPGFGARLLWRRTVGLIGFGKIAQAVARRLAGWDVTLQVYARNPQTVLPPGAKRVELDDLLATSDVVAVLVSLHDDTRHLLDARRLGLMKEGALLVNTARGAIVDEVALYERARDGHIRVALDVFETEPLPADSKLRTLPNTVLTPHLIAGTQDVLDAIGGAAVENAIKLVAGTTPDSVCNRAILPEWTSRWSKVRT